MNFGRDLGYERTYQSTYSYHYRQTEVEQSEYYGESDTNGGRIAAYIFLPCICMTLIVVWVKCGTSIRNFFKNANRKTMRV
jgi:hypothetical protein